jgi:hypothetical protein
MTGQAFAYVGGRVGQNNGHIVGCPNFVCTRELIAILKSNQMQARRAIDCHPRTLIPPLVHKRDAAHSDKPQKTK